MPNKQLFKLVGMSLSVLLYICISPFLIYWISTSLLSDRYSIGIEQDALIYDQIGKEVYTSGSKNYSLLGPQQIIVYSAYKTEVNPNDTSKIQKCSINPIQQKYLYKIHFISFWFFGIPIGFSENSCIG